MTIVVMTREMGTLGKDVAREFARRMGYSVIHHELVRKPGDKPAYSEESEVYRFLEDSERKIEEWRNNRAQSGFLTKSELLEIALEGEVLIRGWGAARLLKSVPNVLSVRVCAPMAFRIEVMKKRLGVDAQTARREIERNDAAHGRTFLRFFQDDWRNPENYDLVLNTEHIEPSTCAEILVDAARATSFAESEETRAVLDDMLLTARIDEALQGAGLSGRRNEHIDVVVNGDDIRLYGVVKDRTKRSLAENVLAREFGISRFQNDILYTRGCGE